MDRHVLFDLDGVVRHFSPSYVAGIERDHGLDPGSIERFAFSSPLIEQVTTGAMTRSRWVELIGQELGNPAAAHKWGNQPSHVDPDVVDLARELRSAGCGTAILTNGTDTIDSEAVALGLPEHFDAIFNSATIGYVKPDIRAFAHVLDALRVRADQVFFTDDSVHKLAGASELGMTTHHFSTTDRLRAALRDWGLAIA